MAKRSAARIAAELQSLRNTPFDERDRRSLVHELSVHHEEMRVQNDALTHAQKALEETRDRFIQLYDLAPVGYVTLDANGVVEQCNLTAAALLGRAKHAVEGYPLLVFVMKADRGRYADYLLRCRRSEPEPEPELEIEVSMLAADGIRAVQLVCRPRRIGPPPHRSFVALIDVTERHALEQERARIAREHAALAARLIGIQDDERQRIARNLHDDIGQQHTAIRLKLDLLALQMTEASASELLDEIQEMFARLDRRLHFVATELRPASLDLGLSTALGQFVREWSKTFRISADFISELPKQTRFSPDVETHLYRIAQEALNNAAKHADARNVSVVLNVRDGDIVLSVGDDGRGFDANRLGDGSPLGLVGMRERAQIIGAHFRIQATPGRGTSIVVNVPARRGEGTFMSAAKPLGRRIGGGVS